MRCAENVSVVMMSAPAVRYLRWMSCTISGLETASSSQHPFTPYCCAIVPIAPSSMSMRWLRISCSDWLCALLFIVSSFVIGFWSFISALICLYRGFVCFSSVALLPMCMHSSSLRSTSCVWYSSTIRSAFSTSSSFLKSISRCMPSPPTLSSNGRSWSSVTQQAMMLFPPAIIFL